MQNVKVISTDLAPQFMYFKHQLYSLATTSEHDIDKPHYCLTYHWSNHIADMFENVNFYFMKILVYGNIALTFYKNDYRH